MTSGQVTNPVVMVVAVNRYDVDIWGPMAERIGEQVPKGSSICVQGKLTPRVWTNKEGKQQTKFRVTKDSLGCMVLAW